MKTRRAEQLSGRIGSQCCLAEVTLRVLAGSDLTWITESLAAACRRLDGSRPRPRVVSAVYIPEDSQLMCVVEAASSEEVQRLFEMALLPSARIRDVLAVAVNPQPGRS
jgi:hypothetical protein